MIIFYLREAVQSITRAKASFVLTTISLTIAVLLILASILTIQVSELFESKLKNNVRVNLFLKENVNEYSIKDYKKELEAKSFVSSVKYINKEEAAELFIRETGENFKEILEYNPLPESFVVGLNKDWVAQDTIKIIIAQFSKYNWVEEVVFRESFIYNLLSYIEKSKQYVFVLTGIIFLISLYLVYSTIRLVIHSRMKELETMKLVGAKLFTIKTPIVLNGLLAGLIAGVLATAIFYLIKSQFITIQSLSLFINKNIYQYLTVLLATGPLFSLIVTIYALRKVSLKI
jgi:cell division transport system permease protein